MLLQFAVENYACFANKVVLSLLAVADEWHPEGQTVDVPGIGPVLRSAVVYGPNASGKSSLVRAFEAVRSMAVDGIPPGEKLPVRPHRLDPALVGQPTTFELELVAGGVHYAYGVRATREAVVEEWLHRVEGAADRVVFQRGGGRISIGDALDLDARRRQFYEFVAEGTRPEQPFLAELRARNATELDAVFELLRRGVGVPPDKVVRPGVLLELLLEFPDRIAAFAKILREADTGVVDIRVVASSPDLQARIDRGERFDDQEAAQLVASGQVRWGFLHGDASGGTTALDMDELSDGTRRLFLTVAPEFQIASQHTIAFFDEFDRSFHTELTRHLVSVRNHLAPQNQCVFTTHDTNLLDGGVFGRDAIWFVEKDANGAARLYSLAEFKSEQLDALNGRVEAGYLGGRFGAIPFLGDPPRSKRSAG